MNKEDRKDLVERLCNISRGDHERGCMGREYVCSCDYDETSWKTAEEAADEITRLRRELEEARQALAQKDIDQGIAAILADDAPANPEDLALFDRAIAAAKERLTSREAAEAIAKAINRAVEDATFRIVDPIAKGLGPALAVERYSNRARTEIVYNSVSDAEKAFRHLSLAFGIAKDALTSPETEREAME